MSTRTSSAALSPSLPHCSALGRLPEALKLGSRRPRTQPSPPHGRVVGSGGRLGLSGAPGRSQLTQPPPGQHAGEFVISPVEGVLRVRKDVELDRETIAFYNLTVCARDRGVPPLSSTVSPGPPFQWLPFTAP